MSFLMPQTIDELVSSLKKMDDNTWICAGATDLVISLKEKKQFHYSLIDLTHLPEIARIEESGEHIKIGAAVTMDDLEHSEAVQRYIPALAESASMVGSTQIRNRGTIGGNVANASQSSDLTPVLLAYGAEAVLCDETGCLRVAKVDDFVKGLGSTTLKRTDVILWFLVKKSDAVSGFSKVGSRKAVTIAKINACVKADLRDGSLTKVSVYLGAVGAKGRPAPCIERVLEGAKLCELKDEAVKAAVYAQIEENIPDRVSKHYKKPAAFAVISDILTDLGKRGGKENS